MISLCEATKRNHELIHQIKILRELYVATSRNSCVDVSDKHRSMLNAELLLNERSIIGIIMKSKYTTEIAHKTHVAQDKMLLQESRAVRDSRTYLIKYEKLRWTDVQTEDSLCLRGPVRQ